MVDAYIRPFRGFRCGHYHSSVNRWPGLSNIFFSNYLSSFTQRLVFRPFVLHERYIASYIHHDKIGQMYAPNDRSFAPNFTSIDAEVRV